MIKGWLGEEAQNHYAAVLANVGLSVTQPRLNLLHCFATAGERHFTVDDLFGYIQRNDVPVNIPTMYRALRQLSEEGILLRTLLRHGHTVYELGPRAPHDHLVCQECGRVEDLQHEVLATARRHIEKSTGYSFREIPAALFGICLACGRMKERGHGVAGQNAARLRARTRGEPGARL